MEAEKQTEKTAGNPNTEGTTVQTDAPGQEPGMKLFAGDKVLWIIIAALAVISVLVVYSSTAKMAYDAHTARSTAHFLRQQLLILFVCVPLIIIGFIAPSITRLGNNASRMLGVAVSIAYASSLGAALFSALSGYLLIPHLSFSSTASHLKALPDVVFELSIPQIMPVMSALVLAIMLGLASAWTKASLISSFLEEFQKIILAIVSRVIIPILPYFIGLTFCSLAYEGTITRQLPVFLQVIVIVLIGHFIWIALLYILAGIYSRENPLKVVKHYGPAYLTAIGTMSSAATLPVALQCAHRAKPLRKDLVDFGIPLFANIHLCGSVLTEVFFCMAISKILYGAVPAPGAMVLFCVLLGIFAIGAPGVPGGTVMASLGIITGILKFGDADYLCPSGQFWDSL